MIARFLIDTSAAARMKQPIVRDRLEPLITGGLVGTCATLDAEALHSARNLGECEQIMTDRRAAFEYLPIDDTTGTERSECSTVWPVRVGTARSASPTCSPPPSPPSTG